MEEEKNNALSFIEKMKQKAINQKTYGGNSVMENAKILVRDCPNCGAGRAKQEGITHCAYCDFEFLSVRLTDGINIKKEHNSK